MSYKKAMWGRSSEKKPYQAIEEHCTQLDSKHNFNALFEEGQQFALTAEEIGRHVEHFKKKIAPVSLLSLIVLWSQHMQKDPVLGQRNLKMMHQLMMTDLLPLCQDKQLIQVKDFAHFNHDSQIDAIRCYKQWPIQQREDFVSFYVEFANWLSLSTYGYIPKAKDPDRKFTARRQLPYDEFIRLISYLPERERILAKLFYFGGERTLEEVISLSVQNIDFDAQQVHFEKHFVRYPAHMMLDLQDFIGTKTKGFVFANKNGERLNHTVPYRALKVAVNKLNLPESFTFKDLVRDY